MPSQLSRLSTIDKTFLIAVLVELGYLALSAAGFPQPAAGLVRLAFIIITILFLIRSGPRLLRTLLWRFAIASSQPGY